MARQHAECVKSATGGPPYIEVFPEADGQTFTYGAILTLNVNGQVQEVTSTDDQILGVSAQAATGVSNSPIKLWLAAPLSVFTMSIAGTDVSSQADAGAVYGIIKEQGVWCIDKSNTIDVRVSVVKPDPRDQEGTVNGNLQVVFIPGIRAVQF